MPEQIFSWYQEKVLQEPQASPGPELPWLRIELKAPTRGLLPDWMQILPISPYYSLITLMP